LSYCVILFLILSLCISKRGWHIMFGGVFLKWWMSKITPRTRSFFQEGSSSKTHLLTCHPLVDTLLNQILCPYLLLVLSKKFLFSTPSFVVFCWAQLAWTLKVSHSLFRDPLGVFCRFVLLNLKNFEELIPMIMNVLCGFILQFFKLETFLNTS
jgi:hypothetical protein